MRAPRRSYTCRREHWNVDSMIETQVTTTKIQMLMSRQYLGIVGSKDKPLEYFFIYFYHCFIIVTSKV